MEAEDIYSIASNVLVIESQAILSLRNRLDKGFVNSIGKILDCKGKVIVSGIGKSGIIAQKIAATLSSTGTSSLYLHAGDALHGDMGVIRKTDIIIGISYSGETEEIIKLLSKAKDYYNNYCIAICGNSSSTIANYVDSFISSRVEQEACPLNIAPTSSSIATLAIGDAIAIVLMKKKKFKIEDFLQSHPLGGIGKKLTTKVNEVMKSNDLPIVSSHSSFKDIILTMTKGKLGLAIVIDSKKLIGVISDGDLRRAWGEKITLETKKAKDIMTTNPKTINVEETIFIAEKSMLRQGITSLIVQKDESVVGIVDLYTLQQALN